MGLFKKDEAETARADMAKAVRKIMTERGLDSIQGAENRKSMEFAATRECEIREILNQNTISINDYNLMDALQKSILIEQNYVIIRILDEMLKK